MLLRDVWPGAVDGTELSGSGQFLNEQEEFTQGHNNWLFSVTVSIASILMLSDMRSMWTCVLGIDREGS